MKKSLFISFSAFLFLVSCQFNQSLHKDFNTGAFWRGDGITANDVSMEIDGKPEARNTFLYAENISLFFSDLKGFTEVDGKVFPKVSMYIIKNKKDTVLSRPDVLDYNKQKGTDYKPLSLNVNFNTVLPYQYNEKYKISVKIFDLKGKGKLNFDMPFSVKENDFYQIKNSTLKYSNIYLWDVTERKSVASPKLNLDHTYILVYEGLKGFEEVASKVFPVFSMKIINDDGKIVVENNDILKDLNNKGAYPSDLRRAQVSLQILFPKEEKLTQHFKIIAKLKDRHSGETLWVTMDAEKQ